MKLNNRLVLETSIAAMLVIFGVVIKNSLEQFGIPNHSIGKPIGMLYFVIGWIYTAYILSVNKSNKLIFVLASAGILLSVMMMKQYMAKKQTPPMAFPAIFAISWIVLGLMTGNHLSGNMKYFGLVASALVLASMMKILPFQRKNKIIDGPGMPLFVMAWVILVFLNSSRNI
jgi:hypothetical protein